MAKNCKLLFLMDLAKNFSRITSVDTDENELEKFADNSVFLRER